MLERLGEVAVIFGRIDASGFNTVRISVINRWFFAVRPV